MCIHCPAMPDQPQGARRPAWKIDCALLRSNSIQIRKYLYTQIHMYMNTQIQIDLCMQIHIYKYIGFEVPSGKFIVHCSVPILYRNTRTYKYKQYTNT